MKEEWTDHVHLIVYEDDSEVQAKIDDILARVGEMGLTRKELEEHGELYELDPVQHTLLSDLKDMEWLLDGYSG